MVGDVFPPLDWQGADLAIGPIVLSATKVEPEPSEVTSDPLLTLLNAEEIS